MDISEYVYRYFEYGGGKFETAQGQSYNWVKPKPNKTQHKERAMNHREHRSIRERLARPSDNVVDAIAAVIIIACLVAMAAFWVSTR